jgi:hypothetical protein
VVVSGRNASEYQPFGYIAAIFGKYPLGSPVFVLSTTPDAFTAVSQYHLRWASRSPCLWMLAAVVQNEVAQVGGPAPRKLLSTPVVKKIAALQRLEVTEDVQRWKPVVVMVKQCHSASMYGFGKWLRLSCVVPEKPPIRSRMEELSPSDTPR